MQRISADGHIANRFTDGNPQEGQEATIVAAAWLNSVQEEIARTIELSGAVLNPANNEQLYNALVALVAGAVGTGGASVPTTRQILTSGLLTGGGNMAADRTHNVGKASSAEILAGTRDDVAITPVGLATAFADAGVPNVWRLQGGRIIMFLRGSVPSASTTNFTLPATFPNACLGAFVNGGATAVGARNNTFVIGDGVSTITVRNHDDNSFGVNIVAFGY